MIDKLKTLMGLTLKELAVKLDEELPPQAYTPVPGGANLTDIDPNYMRKILNSVFGLCGVGWGYDYSPENMTLTSEVRESKNGPYTVVVAVLKYLRFWYKLVDTDGKITVHTIDASGGSENGNAAYAMKGAITNGIGNAVSNIGFQESVYLGLRSHRTVGAKKAPVVGKNGNGNGNGAAATPATRTCPIHNVPMREHQRKDGTGTYFAHQHNGKWCYGKPVEVAKVA